MQGAVKAVKAVVDQVAPAAESVKLLTLRAAEGELPRWDPGAHIDLTLPNWQVRQYSLCGDPNDHRRYQVAVKLENLSRGGSEYIHRFLRPGTEVTVSAPRNTFPATMPPRTLYVAGGIGITALIAMFLRDFDAGREPRLVYAGRGRETMALLQALPQSENVMIAASRNGARIDLARLAQQIPAGTTVAACGPSRMLAQVEEVFGTERFGPLHLERFRAEPRRFRENQPFEVHCARSGTDVEIPAQETLMDSLLFNDLPVASGCREGICGSCQLKVLEGQPEHRDSLGASDDAIYPCVSRSLSDRLVLDL